MGPLTTTTGGATAAREWPVWSTVARVVVTRPQQLDAACALVGGLLAEVDRAASRFRPDSELLRLGRSGHGEAVELSPLLAALLDDALRAARETDGAVDPTLGGALVALGYDRDLALLAPAAGDGARPRPSAGRSAVTVVRRTPGWRQLHLDGLRLTAPAGTQLDLGATAKAGAADRAARLVADRLGTGVLVSLGGDVATAGPAPTGGWQVTVQDLPTDVAQQVSLAAGAAVTTSSTRRRRWRHAGRDVHHLLDPRTGQPVAGPWRTASVVAPDCVRANTASTAALVLGEGATAWLRRTGLPARLVGHAGRVVTLGGWPDDQAPHPAPTAVAS